MSEPEHINQKVRETWETNARFWEEPPGNNTGWSYRRRRNSVDLAGKNN